MTLETRLYIGGQWQRGAGTAENRNPSDVSDLIGQYEQAGAEQVDAAIAAAHAAQPAWAATGPEGRHDILMAIGRELMARAAEIGALLAEEKEKLAAEAQRAQTTLAADSQNLAREISQHILRRPVGGQANS